MQELRELDFLEFTKRDWEVHDAGYLAGNDAAQAAAVAAVIRRQTMEEKKRMIKRQRAKCFLKQRLMGLILIAMGIILPFLADGDGTASLMIVPMGLYLICTRHIDIFDANTEQLRKMKKELREER